MANQQNIAGYIRGDSRLITVQVNQATGNLPYDLTGATVFFTLNTNNDPTSDTGAAIELDSVTNPTQVEITDASAGQATIQLTNTNTQNLVPGTYYYDVQVVDGAGNVISLPQYTFTVVADITRRT